MLSCQDVSARMTDYIEKQIPWWERLSLTMHLLLCDHCARYARQMRATVQAMRRMARPLASDQTVEGVLELVKSRQPIEHPTENRS